MDSFEVNKILGAVLGTLTFTLGLTIVAEMIFESPEPAKAGYEIVVPEETAGAAAAAAPQVEPIANRLAKADVAKGEALTKQCHSCHTFEKGGPNKVGPNLYGVVGNHHAHKDDFSYSQAMAAKKGEQWTFDALDKFLTNPREAIPGTAMSFAGIKKPDQRADVIAYLNKNSDNPLPLPPPEAEGAAAAPADGAAPAGGKAPAEGATAPTPAAGTASPEGGKAPAEGAAPANGKAPADGAAAPADAAKPAAPADAKPAAPADGAKAPADDKVPQPH